MKKQYDTKMLTDELSKSVFFQEPTHQAKQPQEESPLAALSTSQQTAKSTKQQVAKSVRQQNDRAASNQSREAGSTQTDKLPKQQSNKALKRFTSYLQEPTLKALKLLAVQKDMHDYDVLQEAVEQYLEQQQGKKP